MEAIIDTVVTCLLDITRVLVEMYQPAAAEDLSDDSDDDWDAVAYRTRSRTKAFTSQTPGLIFSSVVGARLPDDEAWSKAYLGDPECKLIMDMIRNPGLMVRKTLRQVDSSYQGPLRRDLIAPQRGFITLKEPVEYQSVHRVL